MSKGKFAYIYGNRRWKKMGRNCFTGFSTEEVLQKHQKKASKENLSLMKFPKQDYFASKDFYQKVPIYFLGNANLDCLNKIISNEKIGEKQLIFI